MMRARVLASATVLSVLTMLSVLTACGTSRPTPAAKVTSLDGAELFAMRAIGSNPGCVTCHSQTPNQVLVGPPLVDLAQAASKAGASSTEDYIRTSITDPKAHIVDGFQGAKQMPTNFAAILSETQIQALVDYLLDGQSIDGES